MNTQLYSITDIAAVPGAEPPTLILEQDVELAGINRQLASIREEVDGLPVLFEAMVENLLSTLSQDLVVAIELALERSDAEVDEHYSPQDLVDGLNDYRTRGYQFFCVQAEKYQRSSEIAEEEQSLFALANTPICPSAVKRNRRELYGWMAVVDGTFNEKVFNKDGSLKKAILLAMARHVVFCGGGEVATKPVERLWPVLKADDQLRDSLRAKYSVGPPKSTKTSGPGGQRQDGS
jgi:hypothetical protein